VVIRGTVLALWVSLLLAAFGLSGVLAWSMGLVYSVYDTALLLMTLRASLHLLGSTLPTATATPAGTLGVIVAAHNEATVLPVTLAALWAQSQPPDQIVIADDGSSDATVELLSQHYGLTPPPLGDLSAAGPRWPTLHWLRLPTAERRGR
jgi:cellulose synthase/poly-beta-1,6-N-acetylglucosamine synthase-like glycosyltransferase